MKGILVGYLSNKNIGAWRAYKERAELARRRGISLVNLLIDEENIQRISSGDNVFVRYWNGKSMEEKEIPCPSSFYDRTDVVSRPNSIENLLRLLEDNSCLFVNSPRFRELCIDKWKTYRLLEKNKIPQPKTSIYSEEAIEDFLRKFEFVFIKKRNSSQGKNQLVIKKSASSYSLFSSDEETNLLEKANFDFLIQKLRERKIGKDFIVQQGIDVDTIDGRVYDIRAIFQRGSQGKIGMTCFYVRVGPKNSQQANISNGGHPQDPFVFFEDYEQVLRAVKKEGNKIIEATSKSFVVGEVGIDFVFDKKGDIYTLELNSKPGSIGLRTLREWKPTEEDYHNKGIIPLEYNNEIRKTWGRNLERFLLNPLLYCKYLVETTGEKNET
ncbi:MAG: YheC/YheD family protein [Candidatus Pacearchaeota archaeon]